MKRVFKYLLYRYLQTEWNEREQYEQQQRAMDERTWTNGQISFCHIKKQKSSCPFVHCVRPWLFVHCARPFCSSITLRSCSLCSRHGSNEGNTFGWPRLPER
ncbi:MAG: hypothetical protein WCF65_04500, partial [Parachlamydiaceae bacterium]